MKKIGLIGDGASIHIRRWAHWLREHDFEVHMGLTTWPSEEQMAYPGKDSPYDSCCELKLRSGFGAHMEGVLTTRSWADTYRLPLVHGHYLTSGGFYARWSGAKAKIVSAWGSDIYYNAKLFGQGWLAKSALRGADRVFADSYALQGECTKMCSKPSKVHRILFGIDTTLFSPRRTRRNSPTFLSIRRSEEFFNPSLILREFASMEAETGAKLLLAEPSKDISDDIKQDIDDWGLADAVSFYAPRPYHEMPDLYNQADFAISIPNWDSSSTALMESMACGVPVIASDIPQNREWIINGGNGLLADTRTPGDLSTKMLQACEQGYAYRDDMGAKARAKIVADADFNAQMEKAEEIYMGLLR